MMLGQWSIGPIDKRKAKRARRLHREPIVRRIADILACGVSSKFEYEASCRHGLRAALCLQGQTWRDADKLAVQVVELALHRIGAARPSWAQGQPEYRDYERFFCRNCGRRMETLGRMYCDDHCKDAAASRANWGRIAEDTAVARLAFRAAHGRSAQRVCAHCERSFRVTPHHPLQMYCSKACADAVQTARAFDKARTCARCGRDFHAKDRQHRFCSPACSDGSRAITRTARCVACGAEFTIHGLRDRQFCSKACALRARHAARRAAVGPLVRLCEWCGAEFTLRIPADPRRFCNTSCSASAQHAQARMAEQRRRRQRLRTISIAQLS